MFLLPGSRPPESSRDDRPDTELLARPAAPRTPAWNPSLRSRPRPDFLSSRKILVQHFLRGELPFPSIRRFRCPTWRCFVALRADRRVQFSSRPPSPEPLVGFQKSTRVVARPTYLCHQLQHRRFDPL